MTEDPGAMHAAIVCWFAHGAVKTKEVSVAQTAMIYAHGSALLRRNEIGVLERCGRCRRTCS